MATAIEKPEDPAQKTTQQPRSESAGEKIFDRTVYTGIGFGVNELLSLWVADQFIHGKNLLAKVPGLKTAGSWFSKEGYERASKGFTKVLRFTDKIDKEGKVISANARGANSLLMLTLIAGGTMLVLPMKWLEDSKSYWVKKANHMADKWSDRKLSAEETEARDKEVEEHIACSPRQSWPSMMVGRTIAVATSWATGTFIVGPKNNQRLMDWSERKLTGSVQPEGQKTRPHRYAALGIVETYSCAISSFMLEFMSKLFARRNSKPHDPELCAKIAAEKAAAKPDDDKKTEDSPPASGRYSAAIESQRQQSAAESAAARV